MPRQSSIKILVILFFPILLSLVFVVTSNSEVDELYSWLRTSPSFSAHFSDWNPLDSNPCEWSHMNCSAESFVTGINIDGVELGLSLPSKLSSFPRLQKLVVTNANLSGTSSIGKLGKLQELVLNSNQLTGEIPGELGNCAELRDLIIFDNFLAGEIPQELGGLLKLESIRAGGNKDIAGEIPPELGGCESLRVLGLADTKISGAIPPEIGRLSRLETLSVYTTMISGEIPSEIGNCSELVELFLYQNELSGAIPPEIGRLGKLEKMLLWQNDLAGAIPEEIGECRSLRVVDLSLNSLYGKIPESFANLSNLEELMLSNNNISGSIPSVLFNATKIVQLQLDTNRISGYIPAEIGRLTLLEVFFAWDNLLEGKVPAELSGCRSLQALDLSRNELTGEMPAGLFEIQNLTKLLLMSNRISGNIPAEIGGCASLVRLRLSDNIIGGEIPSEIGLLKALTFLDLSGNRLSGSVPREIGDCGDLQLLNLSNNTLGGDLPISLSSLSKLQVLDLSLNKLHGQIPTEYGRLSSLNRLVLGQNSLSSSIPTAISNCSALQLLDLSRNDLTGPIPAEIFQIQALEIALNLSFNALSGPISPEISSLGKLSVLDLSHNTLSGELLALAGLENLVSLNISHNNFTGFMPDSKLFRQLSPNDVEANPGLCSTCFLALLNGPGAPSPAEISRRRGLKLLAATLVALTIALVALGSVAAFRSRRSRRRSGDESESERGGGAPAPPWQFTPFQKLSFTAEQVMKSLSEANVIGKGVSGVVYRAELGSGETIAVKKLWPAVPGSGGRDSFSAEVETLGSIRHKNIVRLLGCCRNKKTRLLMYDYMVNGSLGSLLHENGGGLEWETRYKIAVGSAHGLAYLHHDCVPPIVHRDIKANNILVGDDFEPYIADFGLAKLVNNGDFGRSSNTVAGSYGYIAPEYGYMMKITEKSDVYSFGVVLLEVLTGKQPIDPTIPEGLHIVDWMRQKRGLLGPEVLDRTLQARPDPEIDEMLQTLGVALLCVNPSPDERPTMKDVAAMLQEIRHQDLCTKIEMLNKTVVSLGSDCSNKNNVDGAQIGRNINTSFSASSLLHSSSSSVIAFKNKISEALSCPSLFIREHLWSQWSLFHF